MSTLDAREYAPDHFRIRLLNLFEAIDEVTDFVDRLSDKVPLDQKTAFNVRLCVYELTSNTIEHGVFDESTPEISVTVRAGTDAVEVSYEDNSGAFDTTVPYRLDVGRKIRTGQRRGLGLFMLNSLADEVVYTRAPDRNRTTLRMRLKDKEAPTDRP